MGEYIPPIGSAAEDAYDSQVARWEEEILKHRPKIIRDKGKKKPNASPKEKGDE